jgi:hypothetical protein
MDIQASIIANTQAFELVQPRQAALYHPTGFAETATMFCVSRGQQRFDAAAHQFFAVGPRMIGSVPLDSVRSTTRSAHSAGQGRNIVDQGQQLRHVVLIGSGDFCRQRQTIGVRNHVVLATRFASIRGIRAGLRPPPTARTLALSMTALDQSICPLPFKASNSTSCNLSQTPAAWKSRSRRQHVIPEHPISGGSASHWIPVFKTKRIPLRATRWETGGRPPLDDGQWTGNKGSMTSHKESGNNGLAMVILLDLATREKPQDTKTSKTSKDQFC